MSVIRNDRIPVSFGFAYVQQHARIACGTQLPRLEVYEPKKGGEIIIWAPIYLQPRQLVIEVKDPK